MRIGGVLAALTLTLGLAACGNGDSEPAEPMPEKNTTATASGPAAQTFGPACSAIPKSGAGSFNGNGSSGIGCQCQPAAEDARRRGDRS